MSSTEVVCYIFGAVPLLVAPGCAWSLDEDAAAETDVDAPLRASCPIFADAGAILGATGRVRTLSLSDEVLVVADEIVTESGAVGNVAWTAERSGDAASCAADLIAGSELRSGLDATPLAGQHPAAFGAVFAAGARVHAFVFVLDGFERIGTGLATWDSARRQFIAAPPYLFASGRPSYGDAALVEGGFVYAYGTASAGFLAEHCFVARAPVDRLFDPTAWQYYQDGNVFGTDPDEAWPIFGGGGGLGVVGRGGRILAIYAPPLGDVAVLRVGLGPTGPWSPATVVTRCQGPKKAFCTGFDWHPEWAGPSAELPAFTYGLSSFEALPAAQRSTRLVSAISP